MARERYEEILLDEMKQASTALMEKATRQVSRGGTA
jgi:hypothetical protein